MGNAATPVLPDFTSQTAAAYKANIDSGFAVADRLAWAFAAHEQDVGSPQPDMTVRLEAGAIFDGTTLTEVAEQDTAVFTAPTTNPRIDRVVIDRGTGVVSVITGSEAPSPVAPAITAGKVPVAQIALVVGQTTITNSDITDERDRGFLGDPQPNVITTRGDVIRGDSSGVAERIPLGTRGQALVSDATDALWGGVGVLETEKATTSGTSKDFTGIPSWVKKVTVMLDRVSTNGTGEIIIQLGDSGGIETTGYTGTVADLSTSAQNANNLSSGFKTLAGSGGAAVVTSGQLICTLEDSPNSQWVCTGNFGRSDSAQVTIVAGTKNLTSALTQVRLTTTNGTDAFDAGTVNIMYE